ncbi:MAG: DUF4198 domain-containing protein [Cyclobacteriaceae bacterium]
MFKTLAILILLCVINILGTAHEFWLEPDKFYFAAGESAKVSLKVGENFIGEAWKVTTARIVRMEQHVGKQLYDLKKLLKDEATDPIQVVLRGEGSHILVMESNTAFIKMDGEKFTEYLVEDGLDDVLYQRKKAETSGDSATEYYSRHTKLLLQTGSKTDDTYKKVCNLPVEIIPDKNPALLKKGDPIAFKILFEGKPLFGAKVKVWNRYNHRTSVQNIFSQQDGMIETHVSNPGNWMVSVVKMVPSKNPKAQYRSYWGTLVFGVR